MVTRGLSERRALTVVRMSASALRYVPRPGSECRPARSHRRAGASPPALWRRHDLPEAAAGRPAWSITNGSIGSTREARLQVSRRRRKKVPVADRQPLAPAARPNEVWSADFVFDRTAEGRVLKCLTIVDDATTEAVAIVPARALGGLPVTRVLDRLAVTRGLPRRCCAPTTAGVLWARHADLGARARRHAAADRAGQADAERLRRIVQWAVPRRVPQRALVHQPGACGGRHRSLATRSTTRSDRRRDSAG